MPKPKEGQKPFRAAAVEAILAAGPLPRVRGEPLDLTRPVDLQTWWIHRMVHSAWPVREKMTLFWHGHFATADRKVNDRGLMLLQNQMLRTHALGNFRALLWAISRDPAMLVFLDGNTNRRKAPNENYARELMELFTLGIGNYTETDVVGAARAFTGWHIDRDARFVFRKNQHDPGRKTFLGETGLWDGDDVIDILVRQPATAKFICRKLFRFFAHPEPTETELQPLVDAYFASGYEIRAVLSALFRSDAFYSERTRRALVKSPAEFVVGALRQLGVGLGDRNAAVQMNQMGQELFNPANVAGWPGGRTWLNASTMLRCANLGRQVANALGAPKGVPVPDGLQPPAETLRKPQEWVEHFLRRFGLAGEVSGATRAALERYAESLGAARANSLEITRALVHMVIASPEYQMA